MKAALFLLLTLTILAKPQPAHAQKTLPGYQVYFGRTPQGWLTLRRWQDDGRYSYWIVNPGNLRTSWYNGPVEALTAVGWHNATIGTPYGLAMAHERLRDHSLQDAGITRTDTTRRGFTLTVDLCPSRKPLDRQFFLDLVEAFEKEERPVPVTITLTGTWMKDHPDDLGWLRQMNARRQLAITWINHSFHHRYDPKAPLAANFILLPGTSLRDEILLQEQVMLAIPLRPAAMFRFPGLVSSKAAFDSVLALGLLPLGSDAWLAKGQRPQNGSLVLVHANGNEPQGLADFLQLIRQKSAAIRKRQYLLYGVEAEVADTK